MTETYLTGEVFRLPRYLQVITSQVALFLAHRGDIVRLDWDLAHESRHPIVELP